MAALKYSRRPRTRNSTRRGGAIFIYFAHWDFEEVVCVCVLSGLRTLFGDGLVCLTAGVLGLDADLLVDERERVFLVSMVEDWVAVKVV